MFQDYKGYEVLSLIKEEVELFILLCILMCLQYLYQASPDTGLGVEVSETDAHQYIGS